MSDTQAEIEARRPRGARSKDITRTGWGTGRRRRTRDMRGSAALCAAADDSAIPLKAGYASRPQNLRKQGKWDINASKRTAGSPRRSSKEVRKESDEGCLGAAKRRVYGNKLEGERGRGFADEDVKLQTKKRVYEGKEALERAFEDEDVDVKSQ
ncbi:hypothetical protein B0H17DRAFT_1150252 [Mycena rosella]|uniref:Uncharacterized protein n=1 Tax=Mycena rosella TaxID=1033263 RepID=A0AAD7BVF3_MYCRO|nr:hypothetical protein B0H17DRAFT_1150252 [Mycena rosella]